MKRAKWLDLITGAFLFFSLFSFHFSLLWADPLAESQARFGEITGTVQILAPGSSEWVDAHIDLPLESGDQIRTGDESRVDLVMSPAALWTLEPDTGVEFSHATSLEGRITLTQGTLLGKVIPTNEPQHWEFDTPVAVCSVRGTEFAIEYSSDHQTHLGVFNGEVEMQPAETATQTFPVSILHATEEGIVQVGKPLRLLHHLSSGIALHAQEFSALRKRMEKMRTTWSPYTTLYRRELRGKFIKPLKRKVT